MKRKAILTFIMAAIAAAATLKTVRVIKKKRREEENIRDIETAFKTKADVSDGFDQESFEIGLFNIFLKYSDEDIFEAMYDIKNLKIWKENPQEPLLQNKQTEIEIESFWSTHNMSPEYIKIKEIIGDEIKAPRDHTSKKTAGFKFPVHLSRAMVSEDVDTMELSMRSRNCLKRAGILTIGNLCEKIKTSSDLKAIRNCGNNSIEEILEKLFCYNYSHLPNEQREEYLKLLKKLNSNPECYDCPYRR